MINPSCYISSHVFEFRTNFPRSLFIGVSRTYIHAVVSFEITINFRPPGSIEHPRQRSSHIPGVFPCWDWQISYPTYNSTQVNKTVSLLKLLPIQVYLQLFPSMSHHITSVFSKLTLSRCLLKIYFHSISCSWIFATPSAVTARSSAFNNVRGMSFV